MMTHKVFSVDCLPLVTCVTDPHYKKWGSGNQI